MSVLFHVTGFGPFGQGEVVANPTQSLVEALPSALAAAPLPPHASLATARTLPVAARIAAATVCKPPQALLASMLPSATVCLHLGVHSTCTQPLLELCAWNEASFRCPDEAGWQPQGESVDTGDSFGLCRHTSLPVAALVAELCSQGHHCGVSSDPGRCELSSRVLRALRYCVLSLTSRSRSQLRLQLRLLRLAACMQRSVCGGEAGALRSRSACEHPAASKAAHLPHRAARRIGCALLATAAASDGHTSIFLSYDVTATLQGTSPEEPCIIAHSIQASMLRLTRRDALHEGPLAVRLSSHAAF
jgi:pyroglutamyl-peptidase